MWQDGYMAGDQGARQLLWAPPLGYTRWHRRTCPRQVEHIHTARNNSADEVAPSVILGTYLGAAVTIANLAAAASHHY